jgi:ABC-type dipeptide/oligopeptide/nickel transport system ATPase component
VISDLNVAVEKLAKDVRESITEAMSEFSKIKSTWDANFRTFEERYRGKLKDLGASTFANAAEEQKNLQAALAKIDDEHIPRQKKLTELCMELSQRWLTIVEDIQKRRESRNVERNRVADQLNIDLAPRVRILLNDGGDIDSYVDFLSSSLEGSGMQRREEQVSALCSALAPNALAEVIDSGDVPRIVSAGMTPANATRVVTPLNRKVTRKLRRLEVPPLVRIQLRREGESTYTDLHGLSVGERCSAILAVALLSKRRPLIIDQPEDDLDHAFVTESVVESLRTAKNERQIVVATHNPNIPVLGDAEMVMRVERLAGKEVCRVKVHGGLELPDITRHVQLLEGGAEAFDKRRRRYGR